MRDLEPVLELFERIETDLNMPKGLKLKLSYIKDSLTDEEEDFGVKLSQVLESLDDISDDASTPDYIRTQIWNIVSMLESVK